MSLIIRVKFVGARMTGMKAPRSWKRAIKGKARVLVSGWCLSERPIGGGQGAGWGFPLPTVSYNAPIKREPEILGKAMRQLNLLHDTFHEFDYLISIMKKVGTGLSSLCAFVVLGLPTAGPKLQCTRGIQAWVLDLTFFSYYPINDIGRVRSKINFFSI